MKLGPLCGFVGVFQAVLYAVLQRYNLTVFNPVVDALISATCSAGGATILYKADPSGK
jgi:hypothetical protein